MSAETTPAEPVDILRGEIGAAMDVTEDGTAMSDPNFEPAVEDVVQAVIRVLADRSTRPAEPAAPVAEAGDGEVRAIETRDVWKEQDVWENLIHTATQHFGHGAVVEFLRREFENVQAVPMARLSTLEAERARADAAEQRAADALARVKELEFGAGFEAAFDAVVRPGSRYENWTPADDPAEIVTDLYNDLEDALARAEKAERRSAQPIIDGLSLASAKALVELFGGDETDMTVEFIPEGHSGPGFYAWCTEYPEDGSDFLGPASEFSSHASREAQPATDGGEAC